MANTCGINTNTNTDCCKKNTCGGGFAFILVLFILIILVGAAWVN
ncbi:TPA: YjcZ family sporulation protein [Candidatus Avacholeplasma faecigallinarum]|nr:YjcZ family sporulation protein [Candidatus Avacholeplasma faecigallinarum]